MCGHCAHLIDVGAREEEADEMSVDLRVLQLVDDVRQNGRIVYVGIGARIQKIPDRVRSPAAVLRGALHEQALGADLLDEAAVQAWGVLCEAGAPLRGKATPRGAGGQARTATSAKAPFGAIATP